jgi:hypothetical protein
MQAPQSLDIPIIDFTDVGHILDLLPPLDVFYKEALPYTAVLKNGWTMRSNHPPLHDKNDRRVHAPDTWVLTTHTVPSAASLRASISTDMRYLQPRLDQLLDATVTDVTSMGRIYPFNTDYVTHLSIRYGALLGTFTISILTIPRVRSEIDKLHQLILAHVSDLL